MVYYDQPTTLYFSHTSKERKRIDRLEVQSYFPLQPIKKKHCCPSAKKDIFENLCSVGFEANDFKICPPDQGCPQGLHLKFLV